MMNGKKKQIMEMGASLQDDHSGKYRETLRNRIIELRQKTEQQLTKETDRDQMKCLEAMMRALMIADRILDKLFVAEPHTMSSQSRVVE